MDRSPSLVLALLARPRFWGPVTRRWNQPLRVHLNLAWVPQPSLSDAWPPMPCLACCLQARSLLPWTRQLASPSGSPPGPTGTCAAPHLTYTPSQFFGGRGSERRSEKKPQVMNHTLFFCICRWPRPGSGSLRVNHIASVYGAAEIQVLCKGFIM